MLKHNSIHTDHLGTPKAITNDKQETVWSIEMDTFGETKSIDSKNNFTFNLRFAGQYFDTETGYHYNYHRYYDPKVGRYLTSDPIGLAGGFNSYNYAYNRPMAFVDPLGLYSAFMDKNFNLDNLWVLNNDIRTNQYYTHKFQPLMPPSYGATYIWIDGGLLDQHAALYLTSPKLGAFIYDPAGSALRNRYDSKGNYLGRYEIKLDDIHSHEVRTQDTIEIPHYSILEDYFKYHLENQKVNTSGKVKSVSLGLKLTKQEIDKLIGFISPDSNSRYSNVTAGLYCATTLRGLLRTNTITYKVLSSNNQLGFIDTPKSLYQDLKDINNGK